MTLRFRLDPVLELRRRRSETIESALAEIERRRAVHASAVDEIRCEMNEVRAGLLRRQATGKVDLRAIAQAQAYHELLERRLVRAEAVLAETCRQADATRAELVVAYQDQKAIEKLKQREQERNDAEARTQEIKLGEEIATVRFNLRARGSP
ncbi:MAG: flagellar export protein FliJ [Dehalococcoidia bacterium]